MNKAEVDAIYALETLIELIKPIMGKYNNPFNEGGSTEWMKYCRVPNTFFESIKRDLSGLHKGDPMYCVSIHRCYRNTINFDDLIPYVFNLLLGKANIDVGIYRTCRDGDGFPIDNKYPIIFDDLIPIMCQYVRKMRYIDFNIEEQSKRGKNLDGLVLYYINCFCAPITNRKRLLELIIQLELEYGSDKNIVDDLRNQLITICLKEKFENIGFIEKYYNLYCEERRLCKALYESEEMFRIFRDRLKGATILSNRERNSIAELNKNIKERENYLNNFKIPVLYKYYKPEIKKLYLERKRERRLSTDATVGW